MANYEATRYDWDGQYLTSVEGVNTGIVIPWGSASIPSGFLECNGQSVSTSTYANLFAVIAYTYGGSGASFNVPDLTDRTVVNKSNTKSLAQTGGANTVTPTGNIGGSLGGTTLTSSEIPSHSHTGAYASAGPGGPEGGTTNLTMGSSQASGSTGGGGSHTHNLSGSFTGDAASVLQPYLVLTYIIKT
jgi:microcystin-dependent protein